MAMEKTYYSYSVRHGVIPLTAKKYERTGQYFYEFILKNQFATGHLNFGCTHDLNDLPHNVFRTEKQAFKAYQKHKQSYLDKIMKRYNHIINGSIYEI